MSLSLLTHFQLPSTLPAELNRQLQPNVADVNQGSYGYQIPISFMKNKRFMKKQHFMKTISWASHTASEPEISGKDRGC